MRRLSAILYGFVAAAFLAAAPAFAHPFESWSAVVVAGDGHAHSGAPSEVFDNGRRDIVKALEAMGFTAGRIAQFSTRPDQDPENNPEASEAAKIDVKFKNLARGSGGGCLMYVTSHGSPQGVLVGDNLISPKELSGLVNDACGDRMAVIVISACFSGVFVPVLRGDNRMVLTAARPDRPSFGCGETNMYTYFDQCFLESVPMAPDFPALGHIVQECVAKREMAEGIPADYASEPQLSVGAMIERALRDYAFPVN